MPANVPDDIVQPFQIDPFRLRGRLTRLGPALDAVLTRHDYPERVAAMLGEAIALAVALSGALKYEGVFTFQTKGDGPIRLMVADVTTAGAIRGYAQFDSAKLAQLGDDAASTVPRLLGAGYLALTVDQGEHTERYQGIVALEGATLAECVHHYFRQSEQVEAGLKVAVARVASPTGGKTWRAGALMIERLPKAEGGDSVREAEDDGWRRAMALMSTSTAAELLDPGLPPEKLLFRLFHEEGVRAYKPHDLAARCRCSRGRVERMLKALGAGELEDLKVDGRLVVTCEFCSASYVFDEEEIAALTPP
ncbi:MAG TPA: Hsp33 family molecular chaperone [Stellaceae bacterium]|nr:Hsp33 family molecular chaperone [Stellaceae bacterium]